jgi:hypothetical protein
MVMVTSRGTEAPLLSVTVDGGDLGDGLAQGQKNSDCSIGAVVCPDVKGPAHVGGV